MQALDAFDKLYDESFSICKFSRTCISEITDMEDAGVEEIQIVLSKNCNGNKVAILGE